jgi:hypothetical protein
MTTRLCPIYSAAGQEKECLTDFCAWWDLNVGQCAMLHASVVLGRVEGRLESVVRQDLQGHATVSVTDWG